MTGSTWVRSLALAISVLAPLALAQSASLALPTTGSVPTGEVRDAPMARPDVIDVGAIVDAALAQADRLPPTTSEVDALALELAFDLPAMHAFVRDHVAFDPYPGVLRGAQGTLSARAGNAWDQALLLHALVVASDYEARFAFGNLDDEAVAALLATAPTGARMPLDDAPIAEVLAMDVGRIGDRARRDHALLLDALGDRPLGGAEPDRTPLLREHVWIQALDDGTWRNLDPLAPYGETLTGATGTADALPEIAHHEVLVRAVAETLEGGELIATTLLEERFDATAAAGMELWFYFQPDREGVGGSVTRLLEGASWLPLLMVDGEVRRGLAFELGGSAGGLAGGGFFGTAGPELVAVRLELESHGPGLPPISSTRVLYDRAPHTGRVDGEFDADDLEPLPEDGAPTAFGGLHHVLVSTGGASPRAHAIARAYAASFAGNELQAADAASDYGLGDLLFPLAVADQTLVVTSERAIVDGLAAPGVRAFVGRPRVYLASLLPYPDVPDGTARWIDLALDGIEVAAPGDAAADRTAHHRLWYGALQTALETEAALQAMRAVGPEDAGVDSLSVAMSGAVLTLVESSGVDAATGPALREALDDGQLAVLVGNAERFWVIDPATGATRSVLEPGVRWANWFSKNYVNAVANTGDALGVGPRGNGGYWRDGKFYRNPRTPPSRCSGGHEYVMLLGCVSLPASMTVGIASGVVVTAIVAWSIVVLEGIFLIL